MPNPPPARILVICLRRLGDVLLATPLIRSLREAYPGTAIDALVFSSTAGVLEGNPDVDRVIPWPSRGGLAAQLGVALPLFRHYDLACAITASDRAQFLAAWASARRVITVQAEFPRPWLNRLRVTYAPDRVHTVRQGLKLAELLGVSSIPEVIPPRSADTARIEALLGEDWPSQRYAVIHPAPMYRYKAWRFEGWKGLIAALQARGLRVLLSGGPGADEQALVASLAASASDTAASAQGIEIVNLAGQLSLAELSRVLQQASVFVGPDTSITHLAAACHAPTLALFGPSSPVAWAPWPQGYAGTSDSPWTLRSASQRIGRVIVLQGARGRFEACIPCLQEGCDRHQGSVSDCLETLPLARVLEALDQLLADGGRAPA